MTGPPVQLFAGHYTSYPACMESTTERSTGQALAKTLRLGVHVGVTAQGFRDRRRGLMAGLSMFLLGILMEAGQHFSPGRAPELGDVIANGAGVSCGALLGLPFRTLIAIF
jgi:VanZ family protein